MRKILSMRGMKRILLLLPFCFFTLLTITAQPSWTKKAGKAVFTLKTFDDNGTMLSSANGVFVSPQGEALSCYTPFKGAARAVVIDADGKEHAVQYMLGASEMYDVAKFKVEVKKAATLPVAAKGLTQGEQTWMLSYRAQKVPTSGVVRKAEIFAAEYEYYTISMPVNEVLEGSPLCDAQGQVVGLMQRQAVQGDTLQYAVSARFADSLRITGLSINDPALKATSIKKDIPQNLDQAVLSLYFGASVLDSATYATLISDFIERFPTAPDGYQYRAQEAFAYGDYAAAQQDMEHAIQLSSHKDEPHFVYSRMIFQKETLPKSTPYEPWSLNVALQEVRQAIALNELPGYKQHEAHILFAMKQYQQASDIYVDLVQTKLRSAELFYEASRCREMLRDTVGQLALLDSALSVFPQPLNRAAAPYLLLRAQVRLTASRYRDAVADLNDYEKLMTAQLTANFYHLRHQAEIGGKLYQLALNDINRAIEIEPKNDFYLSEKASLQVRVGLYEEAKTTARELIALAPDQSDGYLFLGLSLCLAGQREEGLQQLQKALDMGDTQAAELMERFK